MREAPTPDNEPSGGSSAPEPITHLLQAAERGDGRVLDELFARVYEELHRLAHGLRYGRGAETLCTTALVHEAYMKLVPSADLGWESRAHFFGAAARAMRQVLVSAARARLAQKRGGGDWAVTFEEGDHAAAVRPEEVIALDAALDRLSAIEPRRAQVVEHRYFAGLTTEETARALNVSIATVERDWRAARAWLSVQVAGAPGR